MMPSNVTSTDKEHFQSWQYSQICHFDVFIITFRHTGRLKDSEAVAPRSFYEIVVIKNLLYLQENICDGVPFSIKL